MTKRALVLSGGGVVGIAWETGIVAGLADAGVDLSDAGLIVGTSAGSVVGSQLACGMSTAELLAEQLSPPKPQNGDSYTIDMAALQQLAQKFVGITEITADVRREIGQLALGADTVSEERWIGSFEERLGGREWPEKPLIVTAVDVETGDFQPWDQSSGVPLATAVASSCAVPAMFPPVTINGKRYMDGGMYSSVNALVATGYETVLIISFVGAFRVQRGPLGERLDAELDELRASGSRVEEVAPDDAAVAAFGMNPMDPAGRIPAAEAGVRQAKAIADKLRAFWSAPVSADR
ncbi:MAG: patatin-like phospholipase family protein [Dehalococcoidia bacterium]